MRARRASGDSRNGCGATPSCATSSRWLRRWNDVHPIDARVRLCTDSTCTASTRRSTPCCTISSASIRRRRARARERYSCFEHVTATIRRRTASPRRATIIEPCEDDVVRQLVELRHCADEYAASGGAFGEDDFFSAEQNARLVANAERYYRVDVPRPRASSWNLRDTHMVETLDAVVRILERGGDKARVVVWAHNSHLGDARATQMGRSGELNVGQLVRERFGEEACLDRLHDVQRHRHRGARLGRACRTSQRAPGLAGSTEALFHRVGIRELPARPACRVRAGRLRRAAPRARDRRDLSPGDRAAEPLLPR